MHPDLAAGFDLEGRVAVVTGAASGIGREASLMLAKAGARVVLADRNEDGLAQTASQIAALEGNALQQAVDVTDRDQVEALAERAMEAFGRLDIWANIAGVLVSGPVTEATEADFDRVVAVNMKGVYWGCAAAARVMTTQGRGSIINISSTAADFPAPYLSLYAMSKAAVNMLTKTLAHEVGPSGVRVNAIGPGWIETPMVSYRFRTPDGGIDPVKRAETLALRAQVSPLGLTGEPSDIAYAILYLASDASRFVTGQVLRPNGGAAMP